MDSLLAMGIKVKNTTRRLFLSDKRPWFLETRSSTWFITATVCTAIFTDIFLYAVIVPVFPFSLVDRMGVAQDDVQHWLSVLLAVYAAALLVGAPISGYLADQTKYRKGPLLFGLLLVTAATLLLCFARTLPLMILGRLLQGLAASVIWVVGLALLADTVGSDGLAVAMGYVAIGYSLGALVAPLMGGIVYEKSGYYAVFGMTFGVIALDIVLRLTIVERREAKKWLDTDQVNGMVEVPTGPEQAGIQEIGDNKMAAPATGTAENELEQARPSKKKAKVPAILSLWTSRRMLAAFWGNMVLGSVMTGFDTTLTLFVHRTFGWNSLAAGLLFLAPVAPSFLSPIIGGFVDKYGSRWIGAAGFLLTVPFFILLRLVDHDTINQKVLLAALLTLVGCGVALALIAMMSEFGKICSDKEKANPGVFGPGGAYAQSYGIFNISWAAGSLVGAFWAGGIYGATDWATVSWTWALLCGFSTLPVLLFTDGWIGKSDACKWWRQRRERQRNENVR